MVESQPSKLLVAGSIPVSRSKKSQAGHSASCGQTKDAERPGCLEPFAQGDARSLACVDKDEVRVQCGREAYRGACDLGVFVNMAYERVDQRRNSTSDGAPSFERILGEPS